MAWHNRYITCPVSCGKILMNQKKMVGRAGFDGAAQVCDQQVH